MRAPGAIGLVLVLSCAGSSLAGEPPKAEEAARRFRESFQAIQLPDWLFNDAQFLSRLADRGKTFDWTYCGFLSCRVYNAYEWIFEARREQIRELASYPSAIACDIVREGICTLASETRTWKKRASEAEPNLSGDKEYGELAPGARQKAMLGLVRSEVCREMIERDEAVAEEAVRGLIALGRAGQVPWLSGKGLHDPEPAVRRAALAALAELGGADPLATLLAAAAKDSDPSVRAVALSSLGPWTVGQAREAILGGLRDEVPEIRSIAVAYVGQSRLVEAAGALIQALPKEEGRLREEIDLSLFQLVGVRFESDPELWKRWWSENGPSVEERAKSSPGSGLYERILGAPRPPERNAAREGEPRNATVSFFGIPTTSRKVIFLIDRSESMGEPIRREIVPGGGTASRLDTAKASLLKAVEVLPKGAVFGVVVFSDEFRFWRPDMREASAENLAQLRAFLRKVDPRGGTYLQRPLKYAFWAAGAGSGAVLADYRKGGLAADTVYLLSDGQSMEMGIDRAKGIFEFVEGQGRVSPVVIHTIGVGAEVDEDMLRRLSAATGGIYTAVR